jgi:Uncharacterized membrane-anchored protein conserved in bacteria
MPFKFLPAQDNWEKALAGVKVKPDSALSKALDESFKLGADHPEKRLAVLPKILKLATDFKKSKEVVAAGANAVKLVQELIDVIPVVRKEREQEIKEFQKSGVCEIDVQFIIQDWNGKSFQYAKGFATFESPGLPTINKNGPLSASGMSLNDVKLRPNGTVSLFIDTGSQSIEGSRPYEFKPGQKLMQFKAVQHVKTHKTKAKSMNEATKKFGLKGSVGVEFKIVSVGGEVTSESEYKQGYEDEVEWEIEAGVPTFKAFEQTK